MHYYKKEIAHYHKKAGRLTMLQHGAYNLLIDSCYDREIFPTREEAIDWLWASSKEEIEAIEFVLSKFFKLADDRYVQNHIEEDIAKYHANSATNKRIAIEREAKRREESTKRVQVVDEPSPNHESLITNQESGTKNNKPKDKQPDLRPDCVSEQVWKDWKKHRTSKHAITATVIEGFERESKKAGITLEAAIIESIERSWRGFKADWYKDKETISMRVEDF